MSYPITLLCGKKGVGKDTVADIMVRDFGAAKIALADPIKRLGKALFSFTDAQLWGPSALREELVTIPRDFDSRFKSLRSLAHKYLPDGAFPAVSPSRWSEACDAWREKHIGSDTQITVRKALQTLGTEFGREHFGADIWVDYTLGIARKMLTGNSYSPTTGQLEPGKPPDFVVITDGRFANEILAVKAAGGAVWEIAATQGDIYSRDPHASEQLALPKQRVNVRILNNKKHGIDALQREIEKAMGIYEHLTFNTRL